MRTIRRTFLCVVMTCALLTITLARVTAQEPAEQAWGILQTAATSSSSSERLAAMRVLQLLPGQAKAAQLAEQGLLDKDPSVRSSAALSLGTMKSKGSIPKLVTAVHAEKDGDVVMAYAKALTELGDERGYEVYYAIVTGTRKSGQGLVGGQEQELNNVIRNPQQMEAMAFEQGIGFVPFGGVGFKAYQTIRSAQEKEPIVEAAAIRVLATDPDPRTGKALATAATTGKSSLVRAAAYDAIARRKEKSLLPVIKAGLSDEKTEVKVTAAAAVIRLSE